MVYRNLKKKFKINCEFKMLYLGKYFVLNESNIKIFVDLEFRKLVNRIVLE